jgi:hypothetical protein
MDMYMAQGEDEEVWEQISTILVRPLTDRNVHNEAGAAANLLYAQFWRNPSCTRKFLNVEIIETPVTECKTRCLINQN